MRGLKTQCIKRTLLDFIDVYIGYKEEARHLPKTLTVKLGTHTRKIINKTLHFNTSPQVGAYRSYAPRLEHVES